jgi:tetratricopeptide (TPR) repeat protein
MVPLYQGKFSEANAILDHGLAADRMEQFNGKTNALKHVWKAMIYEQRGQLDSALREVEQVKFDYPKFFDPFSKLLTAVNYARLLALHRRFDEAEKVAEDLRRQMGGNLTVITDYWWTLGSIELAKGNWESAVADFENSIRHSDSEFICRASLGTAYLQAGRTNEAIPLLERAVSNYMYQRTIFPIQAVKAYYYLALAYEKVGRNDDAIKQYEEFLDIWKNADPEIAEVIDARRRLTKLKVNI